MIRNKIQSDVETLNTLSAVYPWIPNERTMRPTPEDLSAKASFAPPEGLTKYLLDSLKWEDDWAFAPAMFRYTTAGNHSILWNKGVHMATEIPDARINDQVLKNLEAIVGNSGTFDYAWYKNPKPSILDIWHVQVFWINSLMHPMSL